jgi:DNA-directed RNA polymerase specialized sigma24 family protein
LPAPLRQVLVLRDVEGRSSDDVRRTLSLGADEELGLLHEARGRVRSHLERYLETTEGKQ